MCGPGAPRPEEAPAFAVSAAPKPAPRLEAVFRDVVAVEYVQEGDKVAVDATVREVVQQYFGHAAEAEVGPAGSSLLQRGFRCVAQSVSHL